MHLAFIGSRSQVGLQAPAVAVEVHLSSGLPSFHVVGLAESASRDILSRVRERVRTARARQFDRQGCLNRDLSGDQAVALCQMTSQTREWLVNALERLSVSPRSAHRRLRVARTVADIEGGQCVTKDHLAHALALRETPPGGGAVKSF